METDYLRTLCSVVDHGSFSRAAAALNITQSAVSQRIRFMEERYGSILLDRTASRVMPTGAGKIVIDHAARILQIEKELEDTVRSLGKKGSLFLCCTPTFGIVYLPQVLNRFFLAHSDEVDFKSSLNTPDQAIRSLVSHECNVAVVEYCGEIAPAAVRISSLPPDELVFISAPDLDLPVGTIPLDLLMQHRLVARREGCSSRCLLQENLAPFGKGLDGFRGMIIHDDLYLTIQTVLSGKGVAFVSRSVVKEYLLRGELRVHAVEGFRCLRSRALLVAADRQDDPLVREFVDCVHSVFAGNLEGAG